MKKYLTRNSIGFGFTAAALSASFFYFLFTALNKKEYGLIWLYGSLYAASMFLSGFLWGYFDNVRKTRNDIGFLYNLITFIVTNTVGFLGATFLYKGSDWMVSYVLQLVFWGLGLFIHYYFSRRSIKGMPPDELFV